MKQLPKTLPSIVAMENPSNTARILQDLLEALKEAQTEIAALKERVAELETP